MANANTKRLTKKQYAALSSEEKKALREQKLSEATASYEEALRSLVEGDTYREFLASAAMCHTYSLRNTFWVMAQRGDSFVPPIASFSTWSKDLGYKIRKGERHSKVWVPIQIKIADPDNEEADKDGFIRALRFIPGQVFTRDQVDPIDGKALSIDPPKPAPITGDSHQHLIAALESFAKSNGYSIKHLGPDEHPGAEGLHDKTNMIIAYRPERPSNSIVRCLVHEVIHSFGISYETYGRDRAEIITDSATFLTCRMLGLDIEKTSIPYVASWSGATVDAIGNDLGLMSKLADQVIEGAGLDDALALSEAERAMRTRASAKRERKPA